MAPEVKNAAMKKLFADPRFNVMDGLDIYIDDYSKPDPMPDSVLRKLASAKFLSLFDEEARKQTAQGRWRIAGRGTVERSTAETFPASRLPEAQPASQDADDTTDLRLQQDDAPRGEDARARHWVKNCRFIPACAGARPAAFQRAIKGGAEVVVACTQEKRLFGEIGAADRGGRRRSASSTSARPAAGAATRRRAMPKIAALLAAAHLPDPEPVPTVTYKSPAACWSSARWTRRNALRRWSATCWT